jgi:hypothetical protein
MSAHLAAIILGFSGDILTFAGSALLAVDALWPEKPFEEEEQVIKLRKNPALEKLPIEIDGRILASDKDVRLVFMHRRAKKAIAGFVLIAIGFLALLVTRGLEAAR